MQNRRSFGRRVSALVAGAMAIPFVVRRPASAADVTQTRSVSGFDKVKVNGAFTVDIVAGAAAAQVAVTADQGLADRITTDVQGGTLLVGMKSGTNFLHGTPKVSIKLPVLRSFSNEGASTVKIAGLSGALSLNNSGTSTIVASGRATTLTISQDGTGHIDTTAVDARDVTVDNNGVGSVDVRASGNLTATINGVGSIRYAGNPKVSSTVNGVGHIGRL